MSTKTKTPEELAAENEEAAKAAKLAAKGVNAQGGDDDDDDDDDGENAQGDGLDVGGVVKAIESGEISVADMDAILVAIQNQKTGAPTEDEPTQAPAPAPAPGEAMKKKDITAQFAALAGENQALKARLDNRDADDARGNDIRVAMKRLAGRPLGADLEGTLVKFHKDHGAAAFSAYVDSMAKTAGILPDGGDEDLETFQAMRGKVPEVAMKYHDKGADAVERASQLCREWDALKEAGSGMRASQETYVKTNMERATAS